MGLVFFQYLPAGDQSPWLVVMYAAVSLFSGVACGAVGIGGVVLTPVLIGLSVPAHVATVAVLTSFFPSAVIATLMNIRQKLLHRKGAALLCLGGFPGAIVGALLLDAAPDTALAIIVSSVATFSGLQTLISVARARKHRDDPPEAKGGEAELPGTPTISEEDKDQHAKNCHSLERSAQSISVEVEEHGRQQNRDAEILEQRKETLASLFHTNKDKVLLVTIGFFSSILSVMTSSAGAFITIPLLFLAFGRSLPAFLSVALAWAISCSICGTLALVSAMFSDTDLDLGIALVTFSGILLGLPIGARIGALTSTTKLRVFIAVLLVALGGFSFARLIP